MKSSLLPFIVSSVLLVTAPHGLAGEGEREKHICFREIDRDKDGKVVLEEYSRVFGADEDAYRRIDANGDGVLTHDEYHRSLGHGAR